MKFMLKMSAMTSGSTTKSEVQKNVIEKGKECGEIGICGGLPFPLSKAHLTERFLSCG